MNIEIKITDWVARFGGVTEAATALGVRRETLWRWSTEGECLPEPWAYKALYLTRKAKRAEKRASATL